MLVQACNIQIMLSLLTAMALKTERPLAGSAEAVIFGKYSTDLLSVNLPLLHSIDGETVAGRMQKLDNTTCMPTPCGIVEPAWGIADTLLTLTSGVVVVIGSYQMVKCLRKRAKQAAKLGAKARQWSHKSKSKHARVHPV